MMHVRLLLVLFSLLLTQSASAGGINADWLQMTPRAASPIPSSYGGLYTSSVTGRPTLVDSSGHAFTIGVGSSWVASAGPPSGAVIGDCWRDTTDSNRVYCKESSGIIAQRSDVASPGSFGSGAANLVLAGPTSGGSGPITLRALVAADLTSALGSVYQPLDGDLTAIAALSSTGYLVRTASNTWAPRSLIAGAGIALTSADGVGAGTTIALSRSIITGTGLQGGGDLSIDRTLSIDPTVVTQVGTQTLTNKTISCASNNCSNIANAALVNSAVTVNAGTGLSGGGTASLGGSVTLNLSTVSAANGGTGQTSLTSHGVLLGQGASPVVSPSLGTSGQVLTSAGAGADPTFASPVTATNGEVTLASSPYNVASSSYAAIGMSQAFSPGTYYMAIDLRTLINASVGTGGFIECRLYNTTDSLAINKTNRIGAYEPVTGQQYYGQITINKAVTISGGTKTLDVQCLRSGATTYTTSAVYDDANGESLWTWVKVAS